MGSIWEPQGLMELRDPHGDPSAPWDSKRDWIIYFYMCMKIFLMAGWRFLSRVLLKHASCFASRDDDNGVACHQDNSMRACISMEIIKASFDHELAVKASQESLLQVAWRRYFFLLRACARTLLSVFLTEARLAFSPVSFCDVISLPDLGRHTFVTSFPYQIYDVTKL